MCTHTVRVYIHTVVRVYIHTMKTISDFIFFSFLPSFQTAWIHIFKCLLVNLHLKKAMASVCLDQFQILKLNLFDSYKKIFVIK